MKIAIIGALLLTSAWGGGAIAQTPDYAREQRLADEIVPAIFVGDPVRLPGEDKRNFLGLYTRAPAAKTAIVLVHGIGKDPDWGLIGSLRASLADSGYSTMSIQMPVLAADAKAEEYVALFPIASLRIDAAVQSLRIKGYRSIALVSHSLGSRMCDEYLRAKPREVAAWVAIGMPAEFSGADRFTFPVFDLYGENDLPQVLEAAAQRGRAIKALRGSRQSVVAEADHFFNGRYKELDAQVRGFLDKALR